MVKASSTIPGPFLNLIYTPSILLPTFSQQKAYLFHQELALDWLRDADTSLSASGMEFHTGATCIGAHLQQHTCLSCHWVPA